MSDGVAVGIVGPNADAFFELLLWIKTNVCSGSVEDMCTFTSGSVAKAMADDSEAFHKLLQRLEREFAIKKKRLVTFMCNSAMSAMMDENADVFWTALDRLNKEFGISDERLATFMKAVQRCSSGRMPIASSRCWGDSRRTSASSTWSSL